MGLNFELGWLGLCHKFSSGFCGSHRSMGFASNIVFARAWDCRISLSKLLQDMGDMNLNFVLKKTPSYILDQLVGHSVTIGERQHAHQLDNGSVGPPIY